MPSWADFRRHTSLQTRLTAFRLDAFFSSRLGTDISNLRGSSLYADAEGALDNEK
jgi:hypothetical protein